MTDETTEQAEQAPKLTRREKRFCDLYLTTGLSGAECVRRIGYKGPVAKQVAWRFKQRPAVKRYLMEQRRSAEQDFGIRKEVVLRSLYNAAKGNVKSLYDPATGAPIPIHQLPDDVAAMIEGVEVEELYEGVGNDRKWVGRTVKIKKATRDRSAEVLARVMGWNRDKLELEGLANAPAPVINVAVYEDADEAEKVARAAVSSKQTSA